MPVPMSKSFEAIVIRLTTDNGPLVIVNLYRTGSDPTVSFFFDKLSALLETVVILDCPVVVGGDFDIPVQDATNASACRFAELLASCDLTQHIVGPTHRCGNTIDVLLTQPQFQPLRVDVEPHGMFSDQALVVSWLPVAIEPATVIESVVRGWRKVDRYELCRILEGSELSRPPLEDADVDQLFATYDEVLRGITDRLAPPHASDVAVAVYRMVRRRMSIRAPRMPPT